MTRAIPLAAIFVASSALVHVSSVAAALHRMRAAIESDPLRRLLARSRSADYERTADRLAQIALDALASAAVIVCGGPSDEDGVE